MTNPQPAELMAEVHLKQARLTKFQTQIQAKELQLQAFEASGGVPVVASTFQIPPLAGRRQPHGDAQRQKVSCSLKTRRRSFPKAEKIVADAIAAVGVGGQRMEPLPLEKMDIDDKEAASAEVTSKDVEEMLPEVTPEERKRVSDLFTMAKGKRQRR